MAIYPRHGCSELNFALAFRANSVCYARLRAEDTAKFVCLLKKRSGLSWENLAKALAYADPTGKALHLRSTGDSAIRSGTVKSMTRLALSNGWLSNKEAEVMTSLMRAAEDMASACRRSDLTVTKLSIYFSKLHKSIGLDATGDGCVALAESTYRSILLTRADQLAQEDVDYDFSADAPEQSCPRSSYRGLSSGLH